MADETVRDAVKAQRKKAATRKSATRYKGILARPIQRDRLSLLYDSESEARRIAQERVAKLPGLGEELGIPFDFSPASVFALLMALACREVPGFRVVARAGRRPKRAGLDLALLWLAVKVEVESTGDSLDAAIKRVMKSPEWREKLTTRSNAGVVRQLTVGSVRQLLKEATWWAAMFDDAREWELLQQGKKRAKLRKKAG